jgi:hypothetical protein
MRKYTIFPALISCKRKIITYRMLVNSQCLIMINYWQCQQYCSRPLNDFALQENPSRDAQYNIISNN